MRPRARSSDAGAVDVHPLAILLGVTAGGVLAGIIGAMLTAPVVAVAGGHPPVRP
jgi:predicted PurR-regulated permease PerM